MQFTATFKAFLDGKTQEGEVEYEAVSHTDACFLIREKIDEWAGEAVSTFSDVKITEWRHYSFDELEWAVARVRHAKNKQEERNEEEDGKGDMLVAHAGIHLSTVVDVFGSRDRKFPVAVGYGV